MINTALYVPGHKKKKKKKGKEMFRNARPEK